MQRLVLCFVVFLLSCGSEDGGSGGGGTGGGSATGGTGGSGGGGLPTTCTEGYPTIGTACAVENELCVSCLPSWNCCDEIRCSGGKWALEQSHSYCPADAGADAASD